MSYGYAKAYAYACEPDDFIYDEIHGVQTKRQREFRVTINKLNGKSMLPSRVRLIKNRRILRIYNNEVSENDIIRVLTSDSYGQIYDCYGFAKHGAICVLMTANDGIKTKRCGIVVEFSIIKTDR